MARSVEAYGEKAQKNTGGIGSKFAKTTVLNFRIRDRTV